MSARKSLFILALAVFSFNFSAAQGADVEVTIICEEVANTIWGPYGEFYACMKWYENIDFVTSPNSTVTSITYGNGTAVGTANQIDLLWLAHLRMNFIPNNITTILPNLKALIFYDVSLQTISNENMLQFGSSLEYVDFGSNQLTSLDGNLLENNLNLRVIYFSFSPISRIDRQFFDTLNNMTDIEVVGMNGLSCMNQYFDRSVHGIIETFEWYNSDCFNGNETTTIEPPTDTTPDIETCNDCLIEHLNNSTIQINDNVNTRFNIIENRLEEHETRMEEMDRKLDEILDLLSQLITGDLKKINAL
jgi:hypothetical protein